MCFSPDTEATEIDASRPGNFPDALSARLGSTPPGTGTAGLCAKGASSKSVIWGWDDICRTEPEILALYREAKSVCDTEVADRFCANRVWRALFLPRLKSLVGATALNPVLSTHHCFDLSVAKVYSALPRCRNCSCLF